MHKSYREKYSFLQAYLPINSKTAIKGCLCSLVHITQDDSRLKMSRAGSAAIYIGVFSYHIYLEISLAHSIRRLIIRHAVWN